MTLVSTLDRIIGNFYPFITRNTLLESFIGGPSDEISIAEAKLQAWADGALDIILQRTEFPLTVSVAAASPSVQLEITTGPGTVATTINVNEVIGTNTTFLSNVRPGDTFSIPGVPLTGIVVQVNSDTSLHVDVDASASETGEAYSSTPDFDFTNEFQQDDDFIIAGSKDGNNGRFKVQSITDADTLVLTTNLTNTETGLFFAKTKPRLIAKANALLLFPGRWESDDRIRTDILNRTTIIHRYRGTTQGVVEDFTRLTNDDVLGTTVNLLDTVKNPVILSDDLDINVDVILNVCQFAQDFSQWSAGAGIALTSGDRTGQDGLDSMTKVVAGATLADLRRVESGVVGALTGTTWTFAIDIYSAADATIDTIIEDDGGIETDVVSHTIDGGAITRITHTYTFGTNTDTDVRFGFPDVANNQSKTYFISFAQMEQFASQREFQNTDGARKASTVGSYALTTVTAWSTNPIMGNLFTITKAPGANGKYFAYANATANDVEVGRRAIHSTEFWDFAKSGDIELQFREDRSNDRLYIRFINKSGDDNFRIKLSLSISAGTFASWVQITGTQVMTTGSATSIMQNAGATNDFWEIDDDEIIEGYLTFSAISGDTEFTAVVSETPDDAIGVPRKTLSFIRLGSTPLATRREDKLFNFINNWKYGGLIQERLRTGVPKLGAGGADDETLVDSGGIGLMVDLSTPGVLDIDDFVFVGPDDALIVDLVHFNPENFSEEAIKVLARDHLMPVDVDYVLSFA